MIIKQDELINLREMDMPPQKKAPRIDVPVSEIVGKEIRTTDPRLIKLITKWKQEENKGESVTVTSNYLEDEEKIKELKETFI